MEKYHIKDGKLESYTGREENITVPEGIHTIGEGAFKGCVSLRKVVLPSGLRYIMGDAFKGCRKLEEVEIPEGVIYIGSYAFHRCHALKRVLLPQSVEELGDCAFLYCDSLKEVRIPGVKRLGTQAFANGISLERLEVSEKLEESCICDVFTGCGKVTEISFAGGACVRMPNVVEVAAGGMQVPPLVLLIVRDILRMMELEGRCLIRFRVNIKHVEVPEGITCLAKSCFYDMRGIITVKLPKSLKSIESRAFRNCISLEKVCFGGAQVQIHKDAFRNCTSLKTVRTCDGKEYTFEGISHIKMMNTGNTGADGALEKVLEAGEACAISVGQKVSGRAGDLEVNVVSDLILDLVRVVHKQVLGNFRLSGTMLLKYLGAESRVIVPEGVTRIAEEAFAGKENIDKVILPESLREIGAEAFRDCLLLQTITLPEGLERIGKGAFENCVKLLRISLPSKISTLEARVFRHCRALQEVQFSERLLTIEESAFYGCFALRKVQFPESLTFIGEMAFYRCSGLKEVRIPAKASYVKSLAFAKSGLRKVWVSGRVDGIPNGRMYGEGVFADCMKLKTLLLEEGVQHIPDKFACGCAALDRVVLPKSLKSVGRHPWEGTAFLAQWRSKQAEQMQLEAGRNQQTMQLDVNQNQQTLKKDTSQDWQHLDGMRLSNVQREAAPDTDEGIFWDGRHLEGEVWLSDSVRIVSGGAFYGNRKVTEIHLPDSVQFIGAAAFKGCRELRRVWLPAGIKHLEAEVFAGCGELEEICLVQTPVSDVERSALDEMPAAEETFVSADLSARGRTVGAKLFPVWDTIGERAFYQCRKLKVLRLEQAKSIGKEALAGCTALGRSNVAVNLQIGERAFENTQFLENREDGFSIVGNVIVAGEACSGEVCLPEGVIGIAPYSFSGNREITKLVLPDSLQWIGEGAFFGCSGLYAVKFPKGLRRIGARAFEKCISLQEIECSAWQAGPLAFSGCISIRRAVLPELQILEKRLFAGCCNLEECICEKAKAVQSFCFSGCRKLRGFSFDKLYVVREYAFEGCESIKSAAFGDGICLGEHALEDCCGLEKIILTGEQGTMQLREYAFSGCTSLRQVVHRGKEWMFKCYGDILSEHIPETVRLLFHSAFSCFEVEEEKSLCGYRGAARRVRIPEGICRIEAEVFRDCLLLQEVIFPQSVEYIGARAFHGTAWMERRRKESPMVVVKDMLLDGSGCEGAVEVSAEIRLVCGWAFANGLGIERIRFASARVQVEEYAFRNCIHLREMVLPDGASVKFTGIGDREKDLPPLAKQAVMDSMNCFKTNQEGVLMECTGNISRLTLAYGITAVGEGAFQDGNLLTEITFPDTVKTIGKRAFAGCKWLSEVRQAKGVECIGEMAFSGCGVLRFVELSEQLRQIGARAFENCTSLEEIQIPEGVEEIPERAFYRCHSLKSVRLPASLRRIGKEAFAFCRELRKIQMPEGVHVEERAFFFD